MYRNEKRNFALSFFSKKYQKLLNEKNIDLLYQLKEGGYNREDISGVINKMAAYRSEKDLNDVLESTLETLNNYDIKGIEDKIKNKGLEEHVDILYKNHKEKLLLLNIKTYKASSVLGSKNWCISTSNYYFNMYVKNKGNNNIQLFAYDFKKPSNNKLSLIGFTVNNKNKVNILHAHNKVDQHIRFDFLMNHLKQRGVILNKLMDKMKEKSFLNCELNTIDGLKFMINNNQDLLKGDFKKSKTFYAQKYLNLVFSNKRNFKEQDVYSIKFLINNNDNDFVNNNINNKNLRDGFYNNFNKELKKLNLNKKEDLDFIYNIRDFLKTNLHNKKVKLNFKGVTRGKVFENDPVGYLKYIKGLVATKEYEDFNPKLKMHILTQITKFDKDIGKKRVKKRKLKSP